MGAKTQNGGISLEFLFSSFKYSYLSKKVRTERIEFCFKYNINF